MPKTRIHTRRGRIFHWFKTSSNQGRFQMLRFGPPDLRLYWKSTYTRVWRSWWLLLFVRLTTHIMDALSSEWRAGARYAPGDRVAFKIPDSLGVAAFQCLETRMWFPLFHYSYGGSIDSVTVPQIPARQTIKWASVTWATSTSASSKHSLSLLQVETRSGSIIRKGFQGVDMPTWSVHMTHL